MKMQELSLLQTLTADDFDILCSHASERSYSNNDVIFNEGDDASEFYFIKNGNITIYIKKYHRTEDISTIDSGDCFGEMAIINKSRRTATAKATEDTTLLCLDRKVFRSILNNYPEIGKKIHSLIAMREEELALKESVLDSSGFNIDNVHLSIKGDPSLRETVFNRERYNSIVDLILPDLTPNLVSLLLDRNVFRILLNFNSGEVEVYTLFNPFTPETHAANKLTSTAYLDRHFPAISYNDKSEIILSIYKTLSKTPSLSELSPHWQNLFLNPLKNWKPVPSKKIEHALSQLQTLRSLENYYLRNFSISTIQDVIRMQFNCDGTHIVNNEDYLRFLKENI